MKSTDTWSCNCIGPQNGEPYCPCMMSARGVYEKDGRWIEPQRDLGPIIEAKEAEIEQDVYRSK